MIRTLKRTLRKVFNKKPLPPTHSLKATVTPDHEHPIEPEQIAPNVLKILAKLNDAGYDAYLVGGGVRDLLVGASPKDFDVATNARPEQIKKLFRNCRLIGKRFRLAHIFFHDNEIIEVSTFRAENPDASQHHQRSEHGLITRDNVYGTIDDDAIRRDFTINALYYTSQDNSILDFTNGMQDIKDRVLRIIGDPVERYREDPVRILRAIRLAAKLKFTIDPTTAAPISKSGELITHVAKSRLFDECIKLFHNGNAMGSFALLQQYDLLRFLFPSLDSMLKRGSHHIKEFLQSAFTNTDERIASGKSISPTFLFSALLWPSIEQHWKKIKHHDEPQSELLDQACSAMIAKQLQTLVLTRRLVAGMREIYALQINLQERTQYNVMQTTHDKRFRAAYDLLLLREETDKQLTPDAHWWTEFQKVSKTKRAEMVEALPKK